MRVARRLNTCEERERNRTCRKDDEDGSRMHASKRRSTIYTNPSALGGETKWLPKRDA